MREDSTEKRQAGFVLVVVLWIVTLMSMIALSVIRSSRSDVQWAHNLAEQATAEALADGGIYQGIAALLDMRTSRKWRFDATPYPFSLAAHVITVSIQDERGKIDLNTASDPLLLGLFRSCGLSGEAAAQMVDRIVDWRTPGELHRLNGAKAEQYRAAGYGYEPRSAPFESVSELLLVLGMTRPLFRCARPALTIYSGIAAIDPNVAPRRALLALPGMTPERVERMLAARRRTPTEAELVISPRGVVGMLDTASAGHAFTIDSRVVLGSGISFEREAVVRMTGDRRNPFWIQAWREPSREASAEDSPAR